MNTSAIVMMIVAMVVLWGGLALAILNIARAPQRAPDEAHRDL